ncbi:transcriptional regulator [Pseudomonas aeruginosa]|uniref:Transcriptional regulator n=1 Tax=Pseudomonas aeruginosa TaxID=287 RepID=A0A643ITG4_PSEAI|nr:transcriptional regulator [Pseudomonas aeruginosa]PBL89804.1 transcriptional regulator [Pseudomonas aeruginosa]TEN53442.1 transcriptional regulator [Pseudomonas aeruginosa]TEN72914.1 transcriptional regulator [Pseudomonas aeruginosa]
MGQGAGRRVVLHSGSSRLTKDFQDPSIRSMPRAGGIRRMLGTTTRRKDR